MFRRSKNEQLDLFTNISNQISSRKQKLLDNENSWHNIFYNKVVSLIDETPYAVLYDKTMGRPNSSVRRMIGMMIIKEGQGWSDEQLFDECRFNLKVMRALGLHHMDDDVPAESTYYEFRKLLGEYTEASKRDLIRETFALITSHQVSELNISGKKIRMDSKLINSNIAKSNRLHLIVETVRKYVKGIEIANFEKKLTPNLWTILKELETKSTSNVTYPLSGLEKKERLHQMGHLIKFLIQENEGSLASIYKRLKRLYEEQYEEIPIKITINQEDQGDEDGVKDQEDQEESQGNQTEDQKIDLRLKDPKDIPSSSMQSVHDPEAAYRTKGQGASKQTVHGYHANISESCSPEDEVNLILDVEVVAANICENEFLETGIDQSEGVLQQGHETQTSQIEEVITDGGYDSLDNRSQMLKQDSPMWSIAKTKGGKRIYKIEKNEADEFTVYHLPSQKKCTVQYSQRANKYIIVHRNGTKRYMTIKQIENYLERQTLEQQINPESYNLRANVESTIHQCFHRLRKRNKIVYRGLLKCQWYVISRAFWVNLTRITALKVEKVSKSVILLLKYFMWNLSSINIKILHKLLSIQQIKFAPKT